AAWLPIWQSFVLHSVANRSSHGERNRLKCYPIWRSFDHVPPRAGVFGVNSDILRSYDTFPCGQKTPASLRCIAHIHTRCATQKSLPLDPSRTPFGLSLNGPTDAHPKSHDVPIRPATDSARKIVTRQCTINQAIEPMPIVRVHFPHRPLLAFPDQSK